MNFNTLLDILSHTPTYVIIIFCYLIFVGIKATNTRIVWLPRLFIIPAILVALKYQIFSSYSAYHILSYILFMIFGLSLGAIATRNTKIKIIKENTSIELPGSYTTLVILLSFFCIKYFFGYMQATNPNFVTQYLLIDIAFSALFSGYLLGRALNFLYRYQQT